MPTILTPTANAVKKAAKNIDELFLSFKNLMLKKVAIMNKLIKIISLGL